MQLNIIIKMIFAIIECRRKVRMNWNDRFFLKNDLPALFTVKVEFFINTLSLSPFSENSSSNLFYKNGIIF